MSVDEEKNVGGSVEDRKTEQGLRLLDAEVAQKVLGWSIVPEGDRWRVSRTGEFINSWCVDSPNLANIDSDVDDHLYGRYAMPRYSVHISAAFEVVERMGAQGWQLIAINPRKVGSRADDNVRTWHVGFSDLSCNEGTHESDSLAEAICRAALEATECLSNSARPDDGPAS